jgi:phosphatidylglycerol:prolipoprotein diacylglycerol transferase
MTYIILYSVLRFIIEFYRGDVARGFITPHISLSQGVSILMFLVAMAGFIMLRHGKPRA